ncbi:MAG: type II toxin-antitoxin system VapC family toxin [Candidatus Acidiferrales bacterium]
MNSIVLDASVAAKWFLPAKDEPLASEARHLFRRFSAGQVEFVVPDIFWAEIGNIFWKAIRQGRCTKGTSESAFGFLFDLELASVPSLDLLDLAFEIALSCGRSVYDGLYVSLAVASQSSLVTADERLANALAARFPVRWLGAIDLA